MSKAYRFFIMHFDCICERCGKPFALELPLWEYRRRAHLYCSRSCANARTHRPETKEKISLALRKKPLEIHYCINCHCPLTTHRMKNRSGYCVHCFKRRVPLTPKTRELLHLAGLKSVQSQKNLRRSKNEIAFYEKCAAWFKDVKHNLPMFNGWDADVIINDIRVAVLWNGPWHYRQLTKQHSVLQVQNRDRLKIEEIKKCGYVPYIIEDLGKFSPVKVNEEFSKFEKFVEGLRPQVRVPLLKK